MLKKLFESSILIEEAFEAGEKEKALDMIRVEREAWNKGYTTGLVTAISGVVTGVALAALTNKIRNN